MSNGEKRDGRGEKTDTPTSIEKLRYFYEITPDAPVYQTEFGFYSLDRWKREGHINEGDNLDELFGFDKPAQFSLGNLGWCEAAFHPMFKEEILEDRGEHELVRDKWGRHVLFFKNRRSGFMPEYVDHPVKDMKSWEEKCKWRLDPDAAGRFPDFEGHMKNAGQAVAQGKMIVLNVVGGYMYLRSLIGPMDLLYKFHDDPGLIRDCMETWFDMADNISARYQKYVSIDEFFIGEDICYNKGPLISPEMIREFLFPYYKQLIENIKKRQPEKGRRLHFQLDTDGFSDPVIDLYRELGMDYLSPFEAAAGCDVVRTGKQYPDLRIRGGIDKRILAESKEAIDRELDRIMPAMKKRGGYIPTCDHGVPEEVDFENYMHYRKRMLEYA